MKVDQARETGRGAKVDDARTRSRGPCLDGVYAFPFYADRHVQPHLVVSPIDKAAAPNDRRLISEE
jgi:hypothetical protein